MFNLIRRAFPRLPVVTTSAHVRQSSKGCRAVVTVFRDGKIARSVTSPDAFGSFGEAMALAHHGAMAAQGAADNARHRAITRRVEFVALPVAVALIGFIVPFAF